MYERRKHQLLPFRVFLGRLGRSIGIATLLLGFFLLLGVLGYHLLAGQRWVDALLNASMILAGMGPVDPLPSDAAKVFASGYAIISGCVFIGVIGIVLAPLAHRMLHAFHIEDEG